MTSEDIISCFKSSDALLEGHFVLRSGLHSRRFFQCAMVLQYPRTAERLCAQLAAKLSHLACDAVISPAMGGIVVGHEIGRALGKRHIFAEKEDGKLVLRRNFEVAHGQQFLVVEDVVTRGGRVQETIDIVRQRGGVVSGVGVLVDRSDVSPDFGCPFYSLLRLEVETFPADQIPGDLIDVPAIKPGSK